MRLPHEARSLNPIQLLGANRRVYSSREVVAHYAALEYLTECERLLFATYIKPGMRILDLGVGGGRTTSHLAADASRYVGLDSSAEMVRVCQRKFPGLEFVRADAADLSMFRDCSFDAVVMAFNGLDYVVPKENRLRCLAEVRRVLRSPGTFIFSSHNPRCIIARPGWNRERLRTFTQRVTGGTRGLFSLLFPVFTVVKIFHALLRAAAASLASAIRKVPTPAFWRGEGHLLDPVHGGLITHCWVPKYAITELGRFGFRVVRVMPHDYPRAARTLLTDWYYYVFQVEQGADEFAHCCADRYSG